jgi:hypothetical protein
LLLFSEALADVSEPLVLPDVEDDDGLEELELEDPDDGLVDELLYEEFEFDP